MQRHEGSVDGCEGRARQAAGVSRAELQTLPGRSLGRRRRRHGPSRQPFYPSPLAPFLGKRVAMWACGDGGDFNEAPRTSDVPALDLPAWQSPGPQRNIGGFG